MASNDKTDAQRVDELREHLLSLYPKILLQRIKYHSKYEDVVVLPLEERPHGSRVFKNWMSIILVSGQSLRFTIKVYFDQSDSRHIASKAFDIDESILENKLATDFMKEYCNLTAGYFKKILEESNLMVGISLPFYTRGFYEVFFEQQEKQFNFTDYFKIHHGDVDLIASINLEVFSLTDSERLKEITIEEDASANDEEEIDFL